MTTNTIFLIKPYNPYVAPVSTEIIHYIYKINDRQYAVVETTLNWGQPQLGLSVEEEDNYGYFLYNSLDEAMEYVNLVKGINK